MDNYLAKVYKAGLRFLVPLSPEKTYSIIVNEAMRLVGGNSGIIMLLIEGELKPVYHLAPPLRLTHTPRKNGLTYKAFRTRRAFVAHSNEIHPDSVKAGIKSVIFIPLAYRNRSIGVLVIRSFKEDYFTQDNLAILKLFGSIVSLAIRKVQLYEEVKQALEASDLFLSMAAHELRTPITTIIGYSQLLASKFPKDKSAESRWIEELCWESDRLKDLINELLETNRIKTGNQFHYVFSECHVTKVIDRAISTFNFGHPGRILHLDNKLKKGEDTIVGDFDKLQQMVSNLLDNAAKFSLPDKEIQISLDQNASYLIIKIKDLGQGIEGKALPRIFERFYRGNKNAPEGMGLGLFLAKNIIAQHHGSINIRSKVGKGTTVKIKLPKAKL